MVEGLQGKLAVECDGDEWHGPELYEQDMARQRDLERSGWQFFRVRGGEFYIDPEQTLASLWQKLEDMGIRPSTTPPDESALPATGCLAQSVEIVAADSEGDQEDESATEHLDAQQITLGSAGIDVLANITADVDATVTTASGSDGNGSDADDDAVQEGPQPAKAFFQMRSKESLRSGNLFNHSPGITDSGSGDGGNSEDTESRQTAEARQEPEERKPKRNAGTVAKERQGRCKRMPRADVTVEAEPVNPADQAFVDYVGGVPAEVWFALSHWAKLNNHFEGWERGILYSVGRSISSGKGASIKQARHACRLHKDAIEKGFQPDKDGK